jgi:hypothetical protein
VRLFRTSSGTRTAPAVLAKKLWLDSSAAAASGVSEFDVTDVVADWDWHTDAQQILLQCFTCGVRDFAFDSAFIDVVVKAGAPADHGQCIRHNHESFLQQCILR